MDQSPTIQLPKGDLEVGWNGREAKGEAALRPYADDADARYAAALKLVQAIDHNLRNGTEHYYNTQGIIMFIFYYYCIKINFRVLLKLPAETL